MLEPSKPVTLKTRYTPYPAVELPSDEGRVLLPGSVILRHRHLKQQFTIVPSVSRQRPLAVAPPRCTYQLAPTSAVAAVAPLAAVPPAVALPVGNTAATAAAPPAASPVVAIPMTAGSSVIVPPVVPAPLAVTPSARAPPTANPHVAPVITAAEIPPALHGMSFGKGNGVSPVQPLPVKVASRNTSRSHEIVETSDSNLVVRRGQRAIRDKKGYTTWFYSSGQTYLLEPPLLGSAQLGDLYVHTAANREQQIWIFNRNLRWDRIQPYHPHPVLSGYVLHRVSDGEPRWVQKTTVTTYRGREKRYQQMCSPLEAEAAPVTSSGQAARLADTL